MEIRRFIADIGRVSMALPPANKETRKKVHELANAFGLKSESKGKGEARYTTLRRTSRTGYTVDERKIGRIVRGAGGHGGMFGSSSFGGDREKGKRGKGGGAPVRVPRHREGEEVGGTAPKIGESNVGFKMLAMMGWQDGQRIGVSGGLDAPIAAIMKTTKLGLGATN
uniref:G-patch domain-containing protein n=2 Tax=Schizophyllum commune (strain H4-8 / FGSC 9210) TaxID=578458 RepID=D8QB07_SCHCM